MERRGELEQAVDELADEHRDTCLWFLRPDYYPCTDAERAQILDAIQRRGDLQAFRRAGELRQWLSRLSSETSVSS